MNPEIKFTPFTEKHRKMGAHMHPFAGFLMPVYYTGVIEEHLWTRQNASLFDTSHMGMIFIDGPAQQIEPAMTQNLAKLAQGKCRYGFLLNDNGGVIDDCIVYKMSQTRYMLVVNASTVDKDLQHVRQTVGSDVKVEYKDSLKKLDFQGPKSKEVLLPVAGDVLNELKYFSFGTFEFFGQDVIVSRTGYTGEHGYEFYADEEIIVSLWDVLQEHPAVKPAGLGARDSLRLEMAYPLYGSDLDDNTTPFEAGLGSFLDFDKNFRGKDALLGPRKDCRKHLHFFRCQGKRIARAGFEAFVDGHCAGIVTGGTYSPSLKMPVGAVFLNKNLETGAEFIIKNERGIELPAEVSDKPLYKNGGIRG